MSPEEANESLPAYAENGSGVAFARKDHASDFGQPLTTEHAARAREAWGIELPLVEVLHLRQPRPDHQRVQAPRKGPNPQARHVPPASLLPQRLTDDAPAVDGTRGRRTNEATVSEDGLYRYRLWRECGGGSRSSVTFVMLNPSTADGSHDDPTIRRCVGFARRWQFQRLDVVNLFARRATDPRELSRVSEPVGPENDTHILDACRTAEWVICAWGSRAFAQRRADDVARMLREAGIHLRCLRRSRHGRPWHPLYVSYGTRPISLGDL
jgi:hypothetical protein